MEKIIIIDVKGETNHAYLKNGDLSSSFTATTTTDTFRKVIEESECLDFRGKSKVYLQYWDGNVIQKRLVYGLADIYSALAIVKDWSDRDV